MATPQEQFIDFYRSSLEGMVSMARATLDEAERLRTRQLEAIRDALSVNSALSREIAGAGSAEELFAAQAKFANHQIEVALGYWGKLFEAANHTQLEAMKRIEEQSSQFNDRVSSILDNAPAGAEPFVAAMKSFLQASRAAYGISAQATEQAAKLTEAQFVTATAGIREAVANARKKTA
ncbi:MAG: phasin family protein [Burkholderiales bacterium]